MLASYVTGQSSDLNTGIPYIWVERFYSVQCWVNSSELETIGMQIRLFE